MTEKKIRVMTISDHPLSPSGVGTQTKYMIDHLWKTGKYQFICFGGAVKHADYRMQKIETYGDDVIIHPVDGYGTADKVRQALDVYKPDILWFMTDPRFYEWLWDIEDEVRSKVPMVYHHVWDNYPYPKFNAKFYKSNDVIATISKLTDDIVRTLAPEVRCEYIPHSVDTNIFKKLEKDKIAEIKKRHFGEKFVFFWNSRNARRKMSGSVIWWFAEFLKENNIEDASLVMHTDPKDQNGQDLEAIIVELGLTNGEVRFSTEKRNMEEMSVLYNCADVTICASDAEGFGLSCLESLSCEVPVIATLTGGLQDQVIADDGTHLGVGIEPASKAVIGSQNVPYIYEDRICKEDFKAALKTMYDMPQEEREELGKKCREQVEKNFNPEILLPKWDKLFTELNNTVGSWDTRVYQRWTLREFE
jgi:glycosyltransferase involved in cell wall biosynthesis